MALPMNEQWLMLNVAQCLEDKSLPAVIRGVLQELNNTGYCNVGEFFKNISTADLNILRKYNETISHLGGATPVTSEETEAYVNFSLLAIALVTGQGEVITDDTAIDGIQSLSMCVSLEHLSRHNLVEVFRENWTMVPQDDLAYLTWCKLKK